MSTAACTRWGLEGTGLTVSEVARLAPGRRGTLECSTKLGNSGARVMGWRATRNRLACHAVRTARGVKTEHDGLRDTTTCSTD
jgi:hypothetical protein